MDVPLLRLYDVPGREDSMLLPGASRDRKSALLEEDETLSCFEVLPTLTELEMQAGEVRAFVE
jgi:hypothetical protein